MFKQFRAALRLALIRRGVYIGRRNVNFAVNLANFVI